MSDKPNFPEVHAALVEFVGCIDSTGGVVRDRRGLLAPAADPEWCDLGMAYDLACTALGRPPIVSDAEEEYGE